MDKKEQNKRFHWLADMINIYQYKTGAEIGCRVGATTGYILRNCPSIQMLYAVDIWDVVPESVQTSYWLSV